MANKSRKLKQTIDIPKTNGFEQQRSASPTRYPKTPAPRTPADEAIEFFESGFKKDEPIHVYELALDPDGGPNKEKQVAYRFPSILLTERVICRRDCVVVESLPQGSIGNCAGNLEDRHGPRPSADH